MSPIATNDVLVQVDGRSVLRIETEYPHPREKVWRAVTEPEHLAEWFPARVVLAEQVGGPVTFDLGEGPSPDGTVTELDPPRLLGFTWGGDQLRFELEALGPAHTRLVFTHAFDDHAGAASFAAGWAFCFEGLAAVLAGAEVPEVAPPAMAARHEANVAAFALDRGRVDEGADGWTVRFERQLTQPAGAAWARLVPPGDEAVAGGPPPVPATVAGFTVGPVTAVDEPSLLEYEWRQADVPVGRVRIELRPGTGQGARLVVAHSGPAHLVAERDAALSGWHDRVEHLARQLLADVRP